MTAGKHETNGGLGRAALLAAAFFALGLLAARLLGFMSPPAPPSPPAVVSANPSQPPSAPTAPHVMGVPPDAGGPRVIFDPSSISLLPDASLHIAIPAAPDAGASPP
jgi:hypothetical protein